MKKKEEREKRRREEEEEEKNPSDARQWRGRRRDALLLKGRWRDHGEKVIKEPKFTPSIIE